MSETGPSGETFPLVRFNLSRLIEVDDTVEEAAQLAISAIWRQHVGTPTSANLTFANTISLVLPDGGTSSVRSLYQIDTDTITLALGSIRKDLPGFPLEISAAMHAGHEARHKVQTHLGDRPPDSNRQIAEGTYEDSRHEVEAWQSSIDACTVLFPDRRVEFSVGSHTYSNY